MKINKSLLPIKGHFFIFWGSYASALPFMMVVARQLGIPVSVQGSISAAIIVTAILAKPVVSAAADHFPSLRKSIFLGLLTIMVTTLAPIGFLKPLYPLPEFRGVVVSTAVDEAVGGNSTGVLLTEDEGTCYATAAWDCDVTCPPNNPCPQATSPAGFTLSILLPEHETFTFTGSSDLEDFRRRYTISGLLLASRGPLNVSVQCKGGDWGGRGCLASWQTAEFWLFVTLLLAGQVAACTVESISDAICLDIIGENGDYGGQRAWGALSYGILGTLSGLLVDWYSGPGTVKDYMPAFVLMVLLGTVDILLASFSLRIPKIEGGSPIWRNLRPLLRQSGFFIFLCFAFLIGFFDGLDTGYVFVLQEDIGAGTSLVQHMKFIQGLTMLVQAISAAPFMFIYGTVEARMGSTHVITLVFMLFSLRLGGLAVAGFLGQVWATVAMEVINGPCFGLGYAAIIVQAGSLTPPGASATVQSIVGICYGTLGYAGASFVGGILYDTVGGPWLYLIMSVVSAITCLLHFVYNKYMPQTLERKSVDMEHVEVRFDGNEEEREAVALFKQESADSRSHHCLEASKLSTVV